MAGSFRSSLPHMKARSISAQMKNNQENHSVNSDHKYGLAASMPRIPKDYGIYGDSEEPLQVPEYKCSFIDPNAAMRRSQKLARRSKSQGDILKFSVGTESPSQERINLSLAHSLTEDTLSPSIESRQTNLKSSTPIFTKTLLDPREQLDGDNSMLNSSEYSRVKEMKKRKKDKQKKAMDPLDESRYRKGAANLRDSLKRIFSKRFVNVIFYLSFHNDGSYRYNSDNSLRCFSCVFLDILILKIKV